MLDRLCDASQALPPPGAVDGRGIANAQLKNAMARVATGVRLSVSDTADVQLDQMVLVAAAGRVIDLHRLETQLDDSFPQGVSWTPSEEVARYREGIASRDWQTYPILRFDNTP